MLTIDAREFAAEKHGDQLYDGEPYLRGHLDRVVEVLTRFGITDQNVLAAGYLHDVLEDTETKVLDLIEKFGVTVTHIVTLVTNKSGKNRRERHEKTYTAMAPYADAVSVKLADRIANVEASLFPMGKSLFWMYKKEHDYFRACLCHHEQHGAMWSHLDALLASGGPNHG